MAKSKKPMKKGPVILICVVVLVALFLVLTLRKVPTTSAGDTAETTTEQQYNADELTLAQGDDGWYAYDMNGDIVPYNGLLTNQNGTWVVEDGKANFEYAGLYTDDTGTYYVSGGCVDTNVNGEKYLDGHNYVFVNGKAESSSEETTSSVVN